MKILLLTDCYAPMVNGVVSSVTTLQRGLLAKGHDVRVLSNGDGRVSSFDGDVYRLASIGIGAIYPNARLGRPADRKVLNSIVEWAPDVLHSHTEFVAFWWARRLAEQLGVPLVHTYHTVYEDYTHYFAPSRAVGRHVVSSLSRKIAGVTDLMVAPTAKVEKMLTGYGIDTPIRVIPTGVDLTRFTTSAEGADLVIAPGTRPIRRLPRSSALSRRRVATERQITAAGTGVSRPDLRRRLGIAPEMPVVVFVGRLAQEKNLGETFQLLATLPGDLQWNFMVVGDGPQAGQYQQLAHKLGIGERVIFTGSVDPGYVGAYYRLGDVFVSSSQSETQGLTYLEALASGLPIVCKADPVLDGVVVQGENGYQYEAPEQFAAFMTGLLTDEELREQMGTNARASALAHSEGAFVENVVSAYEQVLLRRRARPRIGRVA